MLSAVWQRWVLANMAGEVVGFGLAAGLGMLSASWLERLAGPTQVMVAIATVVAVGTVEGAAVGLAQWLALRRSVPTISRRAWLTATVAGAIVAWAVGMAVGTSVGDSAGMVEPSGAVMLLIGAGIGVAAGVVLSVPQWLVLRQALAHAGWWVPAHAVAWAVGMLVAFGGMSTIDETTPAAVVLGIGAATGLAMGALVASVTGLALVWLLRANATRAPEAAPRLRGAAART